MADPPPSLERTALQFPSDCPECGAIFPAGTQANTDCPTCRAKAQENARVALARAQAKQWAAELKAAQEKHARVYSQAGPAAVPAPNSRAPRQRKGSVPTLGTPQAAQTPVAPEASVASGSGQHRLQLIKALTDSIVQSSSIGDKRGARQAYEALNR
ncbi:MAG: hypothetical protein KC492_00905, partial [Myxococcales bacterium]|nr:hypothetical protein [Myxococcales bacterium]